MSAGLDPKRTVIELKELRSLTGDTEGAQRVAFTPRGEKTRVWLRAKLEAIPGVAVHAEAAGNLWATLRGVSERELHVEQGPVWLDLNFPPWGGAGHVWGRAPRNHLSQADGTLRQHADEPAKRCVARGGKDERGD